MDSLDLSGRRIEGFLLDLDGALLDGDRLRSDARVFLSEIRKRGMPFVCVSNRSSDDQNTICSILNSDKRLVAPEQIITPVQAAHEYLNRHTPGYVSNVFGTTAFKDSLDELGIGSGQKLGLKCVRRFRVFVLGNVPGFTTSFVNEICQSISRRESTTPRYYRNILVAANPDIGHPGTGGAFMSDTGTIVQEIRRRIRIPVRFIGKPGKTLFRLGIAQLGIPASRLAMIGDNPHTDVLGARRSGLFSILYLPAKTTFLSRAGKYRPDAVCSNYASLLEYMRGECHH